jgi:hypothetical protein
VHAFMGVIAGKAGMQRTALEQDALAQAGLVRTVDRFLDGHQRRQRVARNLGGELQRGGLQLGIGHHARDQAITVGLLCVQHAGRQAHVHGLGFAHGTWQALRAACAGQHGQLDFGQGKLRRLGGDHDVAGQCQFAAAAHGIPRHGRDHRLAHLAYGFPVAGDEAALEHVHVGPVGHHGNVGASGERLVAAGDDDGANVRVSIQAQQRLTQCVHQGVVERIELGGPVQGDDTDTAVPFQQDGGLGHRALLLTRR